MRVKKRIIVDENMEEKSAVLDQFFDCIAKEIRPVLMVPEYATPESIPFLKS